MSKKYVASCKAAISEKISFWEFLKNADSGPLDDDDLKAFYELLEHYRWVEMKEILVEIALTLSGWNALKKRLYSHSNNNAF